MLRRLGFAYPVLGQIQSSAIAAIRPFHVTVVDKRGNPFAGANVTLEAGGGHVDGETDDHGTATFPSVPEGHVKATVLLPKGLQVSQEGDTSSDLFVEVPVCAPVPILSGTEILVGLAGAASAGVGYLTGLKTLEVLGEIAVGGSLFSAIYRNSCAW